MQFLLACVFASLLSGQAHAQVNYSVHFEMEKPEWLLGEPIFCRYVIKNTGDKVISFSYRTPTRTLGTDYDQEPRFVVTDLGGQRLPDPGPRPCGSPQGTAVYGSVTLPPGDVHTERWLLNQWAQFSAPGNYRVRAERRLALLQPDPQGRGFEEKPAAFALAIDELGFKVVRSTPAQIAAAFRPYLAIVENPKEPNPAEAVVVLTSMPQPFFLDQLVAMVKPGNPDRWDRRDVLDGLARLDTPASWKAILQVFLGDDKSENAKSKSPAEKVEDPLRSYALLLLAEKGDPSFIPTFVQMLATSSDPTRGDILRAMGFFHDPQAYQTLYLNLHSAQVTDRMNAILGLKTLGSKEVIPALLAALSDPEVQVQQVANFALEGLTGHKVNLPATPTQEDSQRVADDWHTWWRENAASFSPPHLAPCHDW